MKRRRLPRASAEDLWRQGCHYTNSCPSDVEKRFTNTTPADYILTIGAGGTFFGGLGIGSAEGSALGTGTWGIPSARPFALPGAAGADAAGSSVGSSWIIPVERPFTLPGSRFPVNPDVSIIPVEAGVASESGSGVVDSVQLTPAAIPELTIQPADNGTEAVIVHPETADVLLPRNPFRPPPSAPDIYDNDIELPILTPARPLDPSSNAVEETELFTHFEVDEPPPTSTPIDAARRLLRASARRFGISSAREVPLHAIQGPRQLMAFENPVFDLGELPEPFAEDLSFQVDADMRGPLSRIHRLRFFQTPSGQLGLTRIGEMFGMITRAGRQLFVPRVYYTELSGIFTDPAEIELEMEPITVSESTLIEDAERNILLPRDVLLDAERGFQSNARGTVLSPFPVDISITKDSVARPLYPVIHGPFISLVPLGPSMFIPTASLPYSFLFASALEPSLTKRRKRCFSDNNGCLETK